MRAAGLGCPSRERGATREFSISRCRCREFIPAMCYLVELSLTFGAALSLSLGASALSGGLSSASSALLSVALRKWRSPCVSLTASSLSTSLLTLRPALHSSSRTAYGEPRAVATVISNSTTMRSCSQIMMMRNSWGWSRGKRRS